MTNPRNIKYIVLHCTATHPFATVDSIQRYWKEQLKWKSPGYHYIISANGGVKQLADEIQVTNGVQNYNQVSIHVSYIGGIDEKGNPKDTRTPEQLEAMKRLVQKLRVKYPMAKIQGHRDFPGVKKACPSFDVQEWLVKFILGFYFLFSGAFCFAQDSKITEIKLKSDSMFYKSYRDRQLSEYVGRGMEVKLVNAWVCFVGQHSIEVDSLAVVKLLPVYSYCFNQKGVTFEKITSFKLLSVTSNKLLVDPKSIIKLLISSVDQSKYELIQ